MRIHILCLVLVFWLTGALPGIAASIVPPKFANSLRMEFVLIRPGTFTRGSPPGERGRSKDEGQQKVTISKSFYLQTTEVTVRQWQALMGKPWWGGKKGTPHMPVVRVSFFDVGEFIQKLNQKKEGVYRLPTEAEWEYAARADTVTAYYWGDEADCEKAMFANNEQDRGHCVATYRKMSIPLNQPAPVGSFPPNLWGLYDMHGNVWEWCSDWKQPYPANLAIDPKGPEAGVYKVRRGGSWFGGPRAARSANRNFANPLSMYRTLGFRLVCDTP